MKASSANRINTNSRLCMPSSVAGHVRAFGAVPGCYEDLDQADLVVWSAQRRLVPSVLFRRIVAAREPPVDAW